MAENVVLALSFIVAIIGVARFKKVTTPFKLLSFYLLFEFLDNLLDDYLINTYKNNFPLLHLETIANYIFFSIIYYQLFKNGYIKKLIKISMVLVTMFFLINTIFLQPYYKVFPSNAMLINEVLFVVLSLLLFKQMLLYPVQVNIVKQGVFWYNTAVLFFSTTMFLNFMLINYYLKHNIHPPILIYFWHFIDVALNVLLGMAMLTDKKEYNTSNLSQQIRHAG
jgi:hypothetical protein